MKFSVSVTFFCDGTGRDVTDGRTNGQTDIGTDRLFSENVILDYNNSLSLHFRLKYYLLSLEVLEWDYFD